MTADDRRIERRLHARIWAQRRRAILDTVEINWEGNSRKMSMISLPDGLRIAWHNADLQRRLQATVLLIIDGRATLAEFTHSHTMELCHRALIMSAILHAANYRETHDGRELPSVFRHEREGDLLKLRRFHPANVQIKRRLDAVIADEITRISHHAYATEVTTESGLEISLHSTSHYDDEIRVSHRDIAWSVSAGHRARAAFVAWSRRQASNILDDLPSVSIAPPPTTGGSARLTKALALCHQALTIDPTLSDRSGTPLKPLLEQHVPELLSRHRLAAETADARDTDAIDAELERGISLVCSAIDEGLARIADDRRHALREQLAFLEMRHPAPDRLLGIAPGG